MASTSITLAFGDGVYTFRLGLAQIAEIQTKCGAGIGAIYARLLKGRYILEGENKGFAGEAAYQLADIVETVRQGLIGGGGGEVDGAPVTVNPAVANRLVEAYVLNRPLAESWTLATVIMGALVEGYTPPKEPPAPAAGTEAETPTKGRSTTRKRS